MSESIIQTRNDGKKLLQRNERGFWSVKIIYISEYGDKWERIDWDLHFWSGVVGSDYGELFIKLLVELMAGGAISDCEPEISVLSSNESSLWIADPPS